MLKEIIIRFVWFCIGFIYYTVIYSLISYFITNYLIIVVLID